MTQTRTFDLTIRKAIYPVTSDVLTQAFRSVGAVESVHVQPPQQLPGESDAVVCGTVTFADVGTAAKAFSALQGRAIYPDACIIGLKPITSAEPSVPQFQQQQQQQQQQAPQPHPHMQHHQHQHQHQFAGRGRGFGVDPSAMMLGGRPGAAAGAGVGRGGGLAPPMPMPMAPPQGPAYVIAGNVSTDATLHKLFLLFELYGFVLGLRRQPKHPEQVVAKFETVTDAMAVCKFLDNVPFCGKRLRLRPFPAFVDRNPRLTWGGGGNFTPTDGESGPNNPKDASCTAYDFTTLRNHRAKSLFAVAMPGTRAASARPERKHAPSPYVFVGNISETVSDADLRALFEKASLPLANYERKSPMVAFVELRSTAAAVEALVELYGSNVGERYPKFTFSGVTPAGRPVEVASINLGAGTGAAGMPSNQFDVGVYA